MRRIADHHKERLKHIAHAFHGVYFALVACEAHGLYGYAAATLLAFHMVNYAIHFED